MKPASLLRAVLAAAGLCITAAAEAAEWVPLATPLQGIRVAYDRDRLTVAGSKVTYWRQIEFNVPQPTRQGLVKRGLYRERIDCTEHTLAVLSYLLHGLDGNVVEHSQVPEPETPIIPDSLGDLLEQVLCFYVKDQRERRDSARGSEPQAGAAPPPPAAASPTQAAPSTSNPPAAPTIAEPVPPTPPTAPAPPQPGTVTGVPTATGNAMPAAGKTSPMLPPSALPLRQRDAAALMNELRGFTSRPLARPPARPVPPRPVVPDDSNRTQ